jgi:hypothetical protein
MARLRLRGVAEEAADLRIALDVGGAREVEIAAVGLALGAESVLQVLVGLAPFEGAHVRSCSLPRRTRVRGSK